MLRLVPGTLCILLSFAILAAAFIGLGLALRRSFGLTRITVDDCFTGFWTGFGCVIVFLILWNFLWPVGGAALLVVLAAGTAGLLMVRAELMSLLRASRRPPSWAIAAMALVAFWVANTSIEALENWDSALYHMQGEKWAHTYAVVPGLANLLGPLGFNNTSWLYDAMLDTGIWSGRAWHIANGIFIVALAWQAIVGAARLLEDETPQRSRHLFAFLGLALALNAPLSKRGTSFDTDLPVSLLLMGLVSRWYADELVGPTDEPEERYRLFSLALLLAVAVCLKMNAAIFAAAAFVTAALQWLRRRPRPAAAVRRALLWPTATAAAIAVAWMARGVVLSGYALFPSRLISLPVDWRVSAEHAQAEFMYIANSARASTENIPVMEGVAGIGSWLPNWIGHLADDPFFVLVPLALVLLLVPVVMLAGRDAGSEERQRASGAWWLAAPLIAALLAWFSVSPEPRYAAPLTWSIAAMLASQAVLLRGPALRRTTLRVIWGLGWIVGCAPVIVIPLRTWYNRGMAGNPLVALVREHVRIPQPGHWLDDPSHGGPATDFTTRSGLVLVVPDGRCWDKPLPCTHNPAPNLRLRVPGRLDRGFVADGPWQMRDWPERWRPQILPAFLVSWRRTHPGT